MNIVIGTDHRGFAHKQYIQHQMRSIDGVPIEWIDVGAFDAERSDYPVYAKAACQAMLAGRASHGVLLCATGIGMAIAANRYKGIYAAVAWNAEVARLCKEHDHTNVLVLPSDFLTMQDALALTSIWLTTPVLGGRYEQRIAMID